MFLQETHNVNLWTKQFGCGDGSLIFSHRKSDARGVLIDFREAVKYKVKARYVDKNGRYIYCSCCAN